MQLPPSVGDEVFQGVKILADDLPALKTVDNLRTDIGTAANCWRITQYFRCLLNCCYHPPLSHCDLVDKLRPCARERTSADDRQLPGVEAERVELRTRDDLLVRRPGQHDSVALSALAHDEYE